MEVMPKGNMSTEGETLQVSPSVDMFPFGVTITATVPQRSESPEGLTNYSLYIYIYIYIYIYMYNNIQFSQSYIQR